MILKTSVQWERVLLVDIEGAGSCPAPRKHSILYMAQPVLLHMFHDPVCFIYHLSTDKPLQ